MYYGSHGLFTAKNRWRSTPAQSRSSIVTNSTLMRSPEEFCPINLTGAVELFGIARPNSANGALRTWLEALTRMVIGAASVGLSVATVESEEATALVKLVALY